MTTGKWVTGSATSKVENKPTDGFAMIGETLGTDGTQRAAPRTADQATSEDGRVDKRHTRAKLGTVQEVRYEMARLYRQARNGKVDVSDASKLAHMLSQLSRVIETSDIEARIEELERQRGR
ncbi:hypothetical protein [Paraburkholderia flava]|uniref:hypothetical protein n=1 Tax=Paraburkholderia flava TaxID=2547393 RepID=UPI00105EA257|nr:hypothetical protein [Paraburkholderia flava]